MPLPSKPRWFLACDARQWALPFAVAASDNLVSVYVLCLSLEYARRDDPLRALRARRRRVALTFVVLPTLTLAAAALTGAYLLDAFNVFDALVRRLGCVP